MIVAYFSRGRALTYTLGIIAACGALYAITLYHPANVTLMNYINSKGLFRFYSAVIFWFLGALLVLRQCVILNQIVFRRSEAIWTDKGKIFYMDVMHDIFYHTVRCADVADVYRNSSAIPTFKGIVLQLRSGAEARISTILLSEPEETVLIRLQQACARN